MISIKKNNKNRIIGDNVQNEFFFKYFNAKNHLTITTKIMTPYKDQIG